MGGGPIRLRLPDGVDRTVIEADIVAPRHAVRLKMPGDPRIVVASACSGHGFKFLLATVRRSRRRPAARCRRSM
jgi:hypothetical protein